jgi:hypothetical protein
MSRAPAGYVTDPPITASWAELEFSDTAVGERELAVTRGDDVDATDPRDG